MLKNRVYYKVTVTRGSCEATVFWTESTYEKLMKSLDILDKNAKLDAIELEMISKKEYDNRTN